MLVAAHHAGRLQFFGDLTTARQQGCFQGLSEATARDRLGGLRQGAVRRAPPSVALSVALHPPHRDLQSPPRIRRPERRRLPVQGLSHRGPRPLQNHDAGDRRNANNGNYGFPDFLFCEPHVRNRGAQLVLIFEAAAALGRFARLGSSRMATRFTFFTCHPACLEPRLCAAYSWPSTGATCGGSLPR